MSYSKKIWKDRQSEYPLRRVLTDVSTSESKTVTVTRSEGAVAEQGDAFNAQNMNDLETRIAEEFGNQQDAIEFLNGFAEEAKESSENAEAWAVGTREGVDVPDTDPSYHNNAKYYAEKAAASETNADADAITAAADALTASQKAIDAEAWAVGTRGGTPVEDTDPAYHNNAKYWSGQSAAQTMDALQDVELTDPIGEGDILAYEPTAQKWKNIEILPAEHGGTGGTTGRVTVGQSTLYEIGESATSEGDRTRAAGKFSHAEGLRSESLGIYSHAEGVDTHARGAYSHAGGTGGSAYLMGSFTQGGHGEKYGGELGSYVGDFMFGYSPTNEASVDSPHITGDKTLVNSKNGCSFTVGNTDTVTVPLECGAMYLFLCSSFTKSKGAIYGSTARLLTVPMQPTGKARTTNNLSLGQSTNAPATITMGDQLITVKNAAVARVTQAVLIRVA